MSKPTDYRTREAARRERVEGRRQARARKGEAAKRFTTSNGGK